MGEICMVRGHKTKWHFCYVSVTGCDLLLNFVILLRLRDCLPTDIVFFFFNNLMQIYNLLIIN